MKHAFHIPTIKVPVRSTAVALLFLTAAPALALEKSARPLRYDREDAWAATSTVTLAYYNNCTGWVWVWSGWSPGEKMGVCYDAGNSFGSLNTTWVLAFSPAPSGYGFTGTIGVENACDCTGDLLASQPFLPSSSGWFAVAWGLPVPSRFSINITWQAGSGFTNGTGLASDHPFAGPTGPTACGTCFPSTRASNSLYYGIDGASCPGVTLTDGLCDIEFMMDAGLKYVIDVEEQGWGAIKNLYR